MTRRHRKRLAAPTLTTVVLFGVGACTSSTSADKQVEGPSTPAGIDGATLRGWNDYDYDVQSSIAAVARTAETVVAGEIASWADGRLAGSEDTLDKYAVLEVAVDQTFVADADPNLVFVEVSRGHAALDEDGNELENSVQASVRELEAAAPVGTRVIVLGQPAPSDEDLGDQPGNELLTGWEPPSDTAQLLSPVPQGLLFEDRNGRYVSGVADQHDVEFGDWPATKGRADGFEQLIAELTASLQQH